MARDCPTCMAPMQPLFLEREGAPDVQLDRCARCGGVWFDTGEAEDVSRRRLAWTPGSGPSTGACPGCREALRPGELRARASAQRCPGCHGVWLEEATLTHLGNERLEVLAARALRLTPAAPAPRSSVGFECAKCGQRAPWREANGTSYGLVCRACTPRAVDDPAHGATVLTKTDRFVERMLRAAEPELGRGGSGSRSEPFFADLLDWFLD